MTTATKEILNKALKLKPKQREFLAHALFESVTTDVDVQLTAFEKAELDIRLKEHEANPEEGISWPDLKKEIRQARKKRRSV